MYAFSKMNTFKAKFQSKYLCINVFDYNIKTLYLTFYVQKRIF